MDGEKKNKQSKAEEGAKRLMTTKTNKNRETLAYSSAPTIAPPPHLSRTRSPRSTPLKTTGHEAGTRLSTRSGGLTRSTRDSKMPMAVKGNGSGSGSERGQHALASEGRLTRAKVNNIVVVAEPSSPSSLGRPGRKRQLSDRGGTSGSDALVATRNSKAAKKGTNFSSSSPTKRNAGVGGGPFSKTSTPTPTPPTPMFVVAAPEKLDGAATPVV